MSTEEIVTKIIADQCDMTVESVAREARLVDDLGMNNIDTLEVAMELEEEFDITISRETFAGWRTVGDALDWIAEKVPTGE